MNALYDVNNYNDVIEKSRNKYEYYAVAKENIDATK